MIPDRKAFIRANTRLKPVPHVPEISLHIAEESVPLWQKTEEELERIGLPPPYWAFAWAGGQALARYVLDNPATVAGKRVLVTRASGQAAATSRLLRARGAEPIALPAIAIAPPPDPARVAHAARELCRYDVVAFTSENGVVWFWKQLEAEGRDARAFGR